MAWRSLRGCPGDFYLLSATSSVVCKIAMWYKLLTFECTQHLNNLCGISKSKPHSPQFLHVGNELMLAADGPSGTRIAGFISLLWWFKNGGIVGKHSSGVKEDKWLGLQSTQIFITIEIFR